jgi:hypothetical protein
VGADFTRCASRRSRVVKIKRMKDFGVASAAGQTAQEALVVSLSV